MGKWVERKGEELKRRRKKNKKWKNKPINL